MSEEKKLKITFAPGCFDEFDGTQEELDEMIAEITKIFSEKTPEEVMAMGTPVLDLDDLDPADAKQILRSINSDEERKLH